MAKIIWSKLALVDLDAINFPEAGRQVPEYLRKDIREIIDGNYRIFYKFKRKIFSSSKYITQRET